MRPQTRQTRSNDNATRRAERGNCFSDGCMTKSKANRPAILWSLQQTKTLTKIEQKKKQKRAEESRLHHKKVASRRARALAILARVGRRRSRSISASTRSLAVRATICARPCEWQQRRKQRARPREQLRRRDSRRSSANFSGARLKQTRIATGCRTQKA